MRQPASRKGWKSKADKLWSAYIKNRDKNCQWCGITHWQMHPHHVIGRGEHKTRFLPENGILLCPGCHRKAHNHPFLFKDWFCSDPRRQAIYDKLSVVAYQQERTKLDYQSICESLKGE